LRRLTPVPHIDASCRAHSGHRWARVEKPPQLREAGAPGGRDTACMAGTGEIQEGERRLHETSCTTDTGSDAETPTNFGKMRLSSQCRRRLAGVHASNIAAAGALPTAVPSAIILRDAKVFRTLVKAAGVLAGGFLLAFATAGTVAQDIHNQATTAPTAPTAVRSLRIVAFGDSTTAAAIDWAPAIKTVYADCLPAVLATHGVEAVVINAGIGDTTTRQAVERLDRDVRRYHPDLVVVQFGINDSWIDVDLGKQRPRLNQAEFRANLTAIAHRLRQDGAQVVLMTPNPMRWKDPFYIKAFSEHPGLLDVHAVRGIDRLLDAYAMDVRDVARANSLPLVDVFDAFENYGRVPGQSIDEILLAGDGIHPNETGQRLVCALLTAKILEVLGVRR